MAARPRRSRLPTPASLRDQVVLEEHDLAPDGSFAVVTRRRVQGRHYVSDLWLVPLDSGGRAGEPRRLTKGRHRDMHPAISPDGRRVAFTRADPADDDRRSGIRVLDLERGRTTALALGRRPAGSSAWSPDGRSIAFTAEVGPQRFIVGRK